MNFDMKAPCEDCPFRRGSHMASTLSEGRWQELGREVGYEGKTFTCHKTVRYDLMDEDEDGGEVYPYDGSEQHCAGALIWLRQDDLPNQMVQIAERLGLYDPTGLDTDIDCGPPEHITIPNPWRRT